MEFKDWFLNKYLDWLRERGESAGKVKFAEWLDIPYPQVSNYLSGGYKPKEYDTIIKIADKLGSEIFDLLGLRQPSAYEVVLFPGVPVELRDILYDAFSEISRTLSEDSASGLSPEDKLRLADTIMSKHGINRKVITNSGNNE